MSIHASQGNSPLLYVEVELRTRSIFKFYKFHEQRDVQSKLGRNCGSSILIYVGLAMVSKLKVDTVLKSITVYSEDPNIEARALRAPFNLIFYLED
jgi:hypothetical protein